MLWTGVFSSLKKIFSVCFQLIIVKAIQINLFASK